MPPLPSGGREGLTMSIRWACTWPRPMLLFSIPTKSCVVKMLEAILCLRTIITNIKTCKSAMEQHNIIIHHHTSASPRIKGEVCQLQMRLGKPAIEGNPKRPLRLPDSVIHALRQRRGAQRFGHLATCRLSLSASAA